MVLLFGDILPENPMGAILDTRRAAMEAGKVEGQGAICVPPGEGRSIWVADELMTFKASAADTGGAYALTDSLVPPQGGPPPHIHHREDEAFWVLEGELEVVVGESTFRAGPGSFLHLPKGVLHSYRNSGDGPARFLTLIVPAGLEVFFLEVGKPGTDLSSPPPLCDEDIARLLEVAPTYGVEIPPPPEPQADAPG
ncbi:MAG TPA: quercetin 2,3-dioxygenase [Thermomicrobiales bacterium]|nr:quercetin 2,3-dioxygenase [Thermomicrobiales bacterium]